MYRRSKRGSSWIMLIIGLGIIIGVGYFVLDQPTVSPSEPTESAPIPPTVAVEATRIEPTIQAIPTRQPEVLLIIPKANVGAAVIDVFLDESGSWDVSRLGGNVGHLQGTAWIGQPGNIVLAGHVEKQDGSPSAFAYLTNLDIGDEVLLIESGKSPWIYHVSQIQNVEPNDLSVLYPTEDNQLTLITCDDYDFVSNTYQSRIVISAVSTNEPL